MCRLVYCSECDVVGVAGILRLEVEIVQKLTSKLRQWCVDYMAVLDSDGKIKNKTND